MNFQIKKSACVTATLILASCTWSDPQRVEKDFGNSVRNMVEQQVVAPTPEQVKKNKKPAGIDGDSAINSLGQHRAAQKRRVERRSLESLELNQ